MLLIVSKTQKVLEHVVTRQHAKKKIDNFLVTTNIPIESTVVFKAHNQLHGFVGFFQCNGMYEKTDGFSFHCSTVVFKLPLLE